MAHRAYEIAQKLGLYTNNHQERMIPATMLACLNSSLEAIGFLNDRGITVTELIPMKKILTAGTWNSNGLNSKLKGLEETIIDRKIDWVFVTETWTCRDNDMVYRLENAIHSS